MRRRARARPLRPPGGPAPAARIALVAPLLVLAACDRAQDAPGGVDTSPADTPATLAVTVEPEDGATPPADSRVHLMLADADADGGPRILGQASATATRFPFELDLPARIPAVVGRPVLHARVDTLDGATRFESPGGTPVDPYLSEPATIRVRARAARAPVEATHWRCAESAVASVGRGASARLLVSGRWIDTAASKTGAPALRRTGDTAVLELPDAPPRACTRTSQPSPWFDAYARGVQLRALGNEPGWFVEVGSGPAPSLLAVLDYGSRELRLAQVLAARDGFTGLAQDGTPITLTVETGDCRDAMSGEAFALRVRLEVGGQAYTGCGARLQD